jgi:hypothetical protein
MTSVTDSADAGLSGDILRGAHNISKFLFGDPSKRRQVYHLAADPKNPLPTFKLGATVCARRSTLLQYIKEQEQRNAGAGAAA